MNAPLPRTCGAKRRKASLNYGWSNHLLDNRLHSAFG